MELLDVGLSPEAILLSVDSQRISSALRLLTQLNMVTNSNGIITVTDVGHFAPEFPLSVRNSAFLWNWLNYSGMRFSKKIIEAAMSMFGMDFNHVEIDETSLYSTTTPFQMKEVEEIYKLENENPRSIIDATANIGGDSINFLRLYPYATLNAIEVDTKISRILRRNFHNLPAILGTNRGYNATAINMSAIDYFQEYRYADVIYFDPEWGGKDYKQQTSIDLQLGGYPIGLVAKHILENGMTPLIIMKLPFNANIDKILSDIGVPVQSSIHNVENQLTGQVNFQLLFLRPNRSSFQPDNVMLQNVPPEVPLLSASYPAFPGIVAACLIDSYGPSYFWIPRREPGQSPEEYNTMLRDYKHSKFGKFLGYNDLETALNMWHDLTSTIGGISGNKRDLAKWVRDNSINNKKIRELLTVVSRSERTVRRLGYNVQIGPFTTQGVMNASRPLLLSVYSDMTLIHRRKITYFSPITKEEYRLDNRESVNQLSSNPPPGIIALSTVEIKSQRGTSRVIGFGVDTDNDGLGRPIVVKSRATGKPIPKTRARGRPSTHRVGSTISRGKSSTPQSANQDLLNALDILADLNLDTPSHSSLPATPLVTSSHTAADSSTDITDAIDLLATLDLNISQNVHQDTPQDTPQDTLDFSEVLSISNPPLVIEHVEHDGKIFNLDQE